MSTALTDPGRRRRPGWRAPVAVVVLVLGLVVVVVAGASAGLFQGGGAAPEAALPAPHYVEEAIAAGLDHAYDGDFTFFTGGGVAVFDCDADGRPDVYLAGGSEPAALFRNESQVGGDLAFERVAGDETDLTSVTGAYPVDIDSDGLTDLAVLRVGENVLLRGRGDCRFERANDAWGVDGGDDWTTAFSAVWEGDAAMPTLAFGNYLGLDDAGEPTDACADSHLFRPAGDGAAYGPSLALTPGLCTLSALFSDWDRTGRHDLRLTNDRHYYRDGGEQLWRMEPGQAPRLYGPDDGWAKMQIWGMGIASQDLTGDGRPEVYLTSQGDNKLQSLKDAATGPAYRDIALELGATAHRPFTGGDTHASTAWHPEFQDVNNDTFVDLFVSKGNVEKMTEFASRDPSNLLIGQPDGTFVEAAEEAGILSFERGRGAALVDFNLDGLLDLIEVKRRENVKLWRNVGAGDATAPAPLGHWAAVQLQQESPNRDAVGAWVSVRVGERIMERELTVGGGHAGGQSGWMHFGLGTADRAEVRVQWPDGEVGPWQPLAADSFNVVERGSASVAPWTPGAA